MKVEKAEKLISEQIGTLVLPMRQDGRGPLPDPTEDHALSPIAELVQKLDRSLRVLLIARPVEQRKRVKRKLVASPALGRVGQRRRSLRSRRVNSS
jgi:hypothetical protein